MKKFSAFIKKLFFFSGLTIAFLYSGCSKSDKELTEAQINAVKHLKYFTSQLNIYAACGKCELAQPDIYYYPDNLKNFLNQTKIVNGKALLFLEVMDTSVSGIIESSRFYDELDDGLWVDALLISIEEQRIAEEISSMEEELEELSMDEESEEIERILANEVELSEIIDANKDLKFMEYDDEVFVPQKTEKGWILIHSNKDKVTRTMYDNLYRILEKENWVIKSSSDAKKESEEKYEYYGDTYNLNKKTLDTEEFEQVSYYNEEGQILNVKVLQKYKDNKILISERIYSYENNRILSHESIDYEYKNDYKNLDYKFSKKYIYFYSSDEEIPADFKYYENNQLKMYNKYSAKDSYISQIYFEGGFSVKAVYESGKKVKEIFYLNNEVTRVKEYE